MKVLKIIEKVIFIVAVVLGVAALVFSILLDEPVVALDADDAVMPQTLGLLTLLQYGIRGSAEHGVMTPFAGYFPAAGGLVIVLLLLGGFLRFAQNDVARRVGEALAIAVFGVFLAVGLYAMSAIDPELYTVGLTPLLGLLAAIVFAISAILRGIIAIVRASKPAKAEGQSADEEEQIRQVLRWKELQNKGIITADEFEAKRQAIFGLAKEEEPAPLVVEKK